MRGLVGKLRKSRGRVRTADLVAFVRHLATLLNAGLSLSKCLLTLGKQFEGAQLGEVVDGLVHDVEGGELMSSAMSLRPEVFDTLTVNIVRAGEAGGTLPETLGQLADDMEKKQALRRTVVGAMVYPAIVMVIASGVVGFLLLFVVPTFEDVYEKMHLDLPWITQLLLWASRVMAQWWWVPVVAGVGLTAGWKPLMRVEGVRRRWDVAMLHVPLFGTVRRKAITTRFLSAFATLLGSGVSVVESLRLMSGLVDNTVVQQAITEIRQHVSRGGRMSEPMARYADLFSPMAIQMISVGEETGALPEAAQRTAEFLSQDVEVRVKTLTTLMEPLLTVGLGVVVGTIALAIYLPMFDLMKNVSH